MAKTSAIQRNLKRIKLSKRYYKKRMELKKMGRSVDGDRWQSCLNKELLRMVQSGALEEARDILINGLLDNRQI